MTTNLKRTLIAVALLACGVLAVVFSRGRDPRSQAFRGASVPGSSSAESVGANDVRELTHPVSQEAALPSKKLHPFLDDKYEWTPPVDLGPGINRAGSVDHACISSDGLLMVMSRIERGRSQLWWSVRESERNPFPEATPLPPEVNSDGSDQTPFLSRDGLSLWFASSRSDGAGRSDLYVSRRKSVKDSFEHPVSLGPTINSAGDESSPFVTADELTLLFAAGTPRQIYQAKRKSKEDSFAVPQRLVRINGPSWQEFPRLSQDGLTLVLVVSRMNGSEQRLEVASRPTVDADFDEPVDLGPVNRGVMSGLSLSGDETTVYFSTSQSPRGARGLWMSSRVKKASQAKPAELVNSGSSPPPAVTPFNATQASQHQEAWAKHLDLPVEYTNSIGMKFRLIPPGEFLMGSTPEEIEVALKAAQYPDWREKIVSEGPQHKVILTKPIYVGVTEVTQSQYEQIMGANPSFFSATGRGKEAVAKLETGNHPVESVSWFDTTDFCAKLSRREKLKAFYARSNETVTSLDGTGYRLPTEAEWEYACRAGTTTRFWNGDQEQDLFQAGRFAGNSGNRTHPVGELKANPFGLSDVHGNVWEWVEDSWNPTFYARHQENVAIDPSSPFSAEPNSLLFRGGNWNSFPSECRSSFHLSLSPSARPNYTGFRVVLTAGAVKELLGKTGVNAPPVAVAPFDEKQAQAHQQAWAKHVGMPVEYTNSIGMKFQLIPPGEFLMGSTPEEIEAALNVSDSNWREHIESEGPLHKVILTMPIYVGVTEVTQSQYQQVMGANPSHYSATGKGTGQVANLETGNHPVEMVSWYDAADFCAKLSQQEKRKPFYSRSGESVTMLEGTGYRLPTEAEWEYACRAGTTTRFWSGDQDQDLISAGWHSKNDGHRTHVAGELKPNPFGLSDMHGNVWEWVQDGWDPVVYSQFQKTAARDPFRLFLSDQSPRPIRGGDWHSVPFECRSATRLRSWPNWQRDNMGFRVVLIVGTASEPEPHTDDNT